MTVSEHISALMERQQGSMSAETVVLLVAARRCAEGGKMPSTFALQAAIAALEIAREIKKESEVAG